MRFADRVMAISGVFFLALVLTLAYSLVNQNHNTVLMVYILTPVSVLCSGLVVSFHYPDLSQPDTDRTRVATYLAFMGGCGMLLVSLQVFRFIFSL